MPQLAELLHRLTPALIGAPVLPDQQYRRNVAGLAFFEPDASSISYADALVVGVGISSVEQAIVGINSLSGAIGMLVRAQIASSELIEAAQEAGLALLTCLPNLPWNRIIPLLESALSRPAYGMLGQTNSAVLNFTSNLFELAEALAPMVSASVAITNVSGLVLAFSRNVDVDSMLDGQIAETAIAVDQAVLRQLYEGNAPLLIPPRQPKSAFRLGFPLRGESATLGSIWLFTRDRPSKTHERVLRQAATLVGLHLAYRSLVSERQSHANHSVVNQLLSGSADIMTSLDWTRSRSSRYQAIAVRFASAPTDKAALTDVVGGLDEYLAQAGIASVGAVLGETGYAVVSPAETMNADFVSREITSFTNKLSSSGYQPEVLTGIGRPVDSVLELPRSRQQADYVVRFLQRSFGSSSLRVASVGDVGAQALLVKLAEICADDPDLGGAAVRRIRNYDATHLTQLEATLGMWLECQCSSDAAAARLHVHPNTVRYRMRQLREESLIDLDSTAERIAAYLHLRS